MLQVIGDSLHQWEKGRKVKIECEESFTEVHFSHLVDSEALIVAVLGDTAEIPNILLRINGYIKAYLVRKEGEVEHTLCSNTFFVYGRPKPADYVYTETEVKNYDVLLKRIEALETNGTGGSVAIDKELSEISENSVQNKVITKELKRKSNVIINTASGENIVVKDSANETIESMRVCGKSEQLTTTGAQLLKYPYVQITHAENGVTMTDNGDGSIHFKGSATAETYFNFYQNTDEKRLDLEAGTYTVSADKLSMVRCSGNVYDTNNNRLLDESVNLTSSRLTKTFTIDKNGGMFLYAYVESGKTVDETIHIMLNKGTTALPYEPYTGGIPSPNPQYPQKINSVGDGGSVEVKVDSQSVIFDTPNGLRGIKVNNSTLANYTDSNGQMWCCDEIDVKRGKYIHRLWKGKPIRPIVFEKKDDNNRGCCTTNPFGVTFANGEKLSMCSVATWSKWGVGADLTFSISGTAFYYKDNNKSLEEMNAMFAEIGTNFEVLGILATPIETDLSDMQLSTMNYPTTTLLSDAHIEVDYVADTKNYIDNKLAEIATALVAMGV